MDYAQILEYLQTTDHDKLQKLFDQACAVRDEAVGKKVYLRGIIEFSNHCRNTCAYCGLNKHNQKLQRYSLTLEEVMTSIDLIAQCKIWTVVLQSGEEDDLDPDWLTDLIKTIKNKYPQMAITLSVGERTLEEYKLWRAAGADRYLLKIETSDEALYEKHHRDMKFENRLNCLNQLRELGYEVGSGVIIGLPGQTPEILAKDILFFKDWDIDMIGIGPFIPHKETPLNAHLHGDHLLTLKAIALTRILTKNTNIPATTALGSLEKDYRVDALKAGANVLMPNFTPVKYKALYEIYPDKRCITEATGACAGCMNKLAKQAGLTISESTGYRIN